MKIYILFVLAFVFGSICYLEAAPTTYDQRQEGASNLDAKIENVLIVFAPPGSMDFLTNLANQALELKNLASRHGSKGQDAEGSKTTKFQVEDTQERSKEPYRVEIVRIEKDETDLPHQSQREINEDRQNNAQISEIPKESLEETTVKKIRSLPEEVPGSIDAEENKSESDESGPKKYGEILQQNEPAMMEFEDSKISESSPGKPGETMKKQLPKEEDIPVEEDKEEENIQELKDEAHLSKKISR